MNAWHDLLPLRAYLRLDPALGKAVVARPRALASALHERLAAEATNPRMAYALAALEGLCLGGDGLLDDVANELLLEAVLKHPRQLTGWLAEALGRQAPKGTDDPTLDPLEAELGYAL